MQTTELAPKPAAAAKSLRKVSFVKPPKKEDKKSEYPVCEDPAGQIAVIAERIKKREEELEALIGAQETDKAELKMFVAPFYFKVNQGKPQPPSSVSVNSSAGEVLVTYQNRYTKVESEEGLAPILGDQL